MNKNVLALVAVLVTIAISVWVFKPTVNVSVQTPPQFGAGGFPEGDNACTSSNGLTTCRTRKALNTASSTSCALLSPSSTSTLRATGFQVTTSTSTAVTITVATSSTAFATTTVYNTFALGSGQNVSLTQTPTTTTSQIMAPSTYVVWSAQGFVGAGTTKFLGTCYGEWTVN